MKIQTKLFLFFLIITLPLVFVPLQLQKTISESQKTIQYIVNHDIPVQTDSRELEKTIVEIHTEYRRYLSTGNERALNRLIDQVKKYETDIAKEKNLVQDNYSAARRIQTIKNLQDEWFFQAGLPGIINVIEESTKPNGKKTYADSSLSEPLLNEVQRQFSLFNNEQQKASQERQIYSQYLTEAFNRLLIITLALGFAGFAIFLLVVLKMYIDPLYKLIFVSRQIAEGDLTKRAVVHSNDEIGQLESSFNTMIDMVQHSHIQLEERVRQRTNELAHNMNVLEQEKAKDEALLANIGEGIIATDSEGKILFVNKSTSEMLGWSAKEMVGQKLGDAVAIEDEMQNKLSAEEHLIHQAISTGKKLITTINTPYYWLRRDRTRFPAAITVTPIKSDNKNIGAIIIFRDFTKEKEVDKAKNEFVSLASHQLRTPLSIINWYGEMFAAGDAGKLTKKQEKYIQEIYHANERMIELVSALLNVSRLDLGTFIFEPEDIDLTTISQKALSELKNIIETKKLTIKENYPSDPIMIHIDRKIAMIIIQNLLSNAVKYTPSSGKVEIEIAKLIHENSILIKISDNGYGIPKSEQTRIFEKLYRAENVRTKDTEGTGLGLYLVRAVVRRLGGKIWFESEENKGSTFYVSLPLTKK